MIQELLIFSLVFGIGSTLTCHSCDNFLSCATPFPQECPPKSKCYTLTKNHGQDVIAKGCAHACEALPSMEGSFCTTCHHTDYCNDRGTQIGKGVVVQQEPAIGGGVSIDTGYHIGGGVRPISTSNVPKFTLMAVFTPFIIFY